MTNLEGLMSNSPKRLRLSHYSPPEALSMWVPSADVRAEDKTDNTISILDEIGLNPWTGGGVTTKRISSALRSIGERDVVVNINSPGGSFFEGLSIYLALKQHPGKVTVNVLGVAASAASVIAMAGDTVNIAKVGFLMLHHTMIGVYGNKETFRREADWLTQFDDVAAEIYANKSGGDVGAISKRLADATESGIWLSGRKAVDEGFADDYLAFEVENTAKTPEQKALTAQRQIDNLLSLHEYTRAARKEIQQQLKGGKPSAAQDDKLRAVTETEVASDLLKSIRQHGENHV